MVETVAKLTDKQPTIEISGRFRVGDIRHAVADMHRYESLLGGWNPTSLEQGLRQYLDWYLAQTPPSKADLQASLAEMEQKGLLQTSNKGETRDMPKVSIVLPNYNYARYLDERIQSLLNQTYSDFELIILDDASTDNSIEVIEKYTGDTRVTTKFYSENSGLPYKRWNDGADLSQGEYLLIAGADDSCHPMLLEKLVEKLDAHPSVGLAFSQSLETDINGNYVCSLIEWTNHLDQERWKADFVEKGKNELQYLLFQCTIPTASSVLMRREVFIKAGKFDVNLRLAADYLLWIKMLTISDIAFIAEPLNYFRRHVGTVTSSVSKNGVQLEKYY
jgi:cellulose synthase/poly-beta-1,6-N-acetylglucosamine synthase-like glycosyltransferase